MQVIDNLGPLELILNTPSHHRVHHGTASPSVLTSMCLSAHHHGVLCPSSFLFLSSSLAYSLSLIPCIVSQPPTGRNPYCIDKNYGTYITVIVSQTHTCTTLPPLKHTRVQHCHLSNVFTHTNLPYASFIHAQLVCSSSGTACLEHFSPREKRSFMVLSTLSARGTPSGHRQGINLSWFHTLPILPLS